MSVHAPVSKGGQSPKEQAIAVQEVFSKMRATLAISVGLGAHDAVIDLCDLDIDARFMVKEILGVGEVSARIDCAGGRRIDVHETTFSGIWHVFETAASGSLNWDRIEICAFPRIVWEEAAAHAHLSAAVATTQETHRLEAALLSEISDKMQQDSAQERIIDLASLPLDAESIKWIEDALGSGNCSISSRTYGKCQANSTGWANVWRVRHFNAMGNPVHDWLEVASLPAGLEAVAEDIAETRERLKETCDWLQQTFPV